MPPKKGRRTNPPKTAVFSITDVIDQPLHVLANAINALRGRPEPMAPCEALGVAREGSTLLQRAVSAIDRGLVSDALPATIALILDGAAISREVELEFGQNFVNHLPGSINDLDTVFTFTVVKQRVPAEVQIDVLEVMQILCDNASSKELMGQRFMSRLAMLLAGSQLHFALHRALGTALIQLVKSSTENKLRLASYRPVCEALLKTTDYFLQQQCMEVLYRVSRQHPRLLDGVRGELPPELYDGIRTMIPSNMFERICSLLDAFNAARDPKMILSFPVNRVDVADAPFTASTKVYFAPEFFIVFVPETFAENVTIEYSCLRSIKMNKEGNYSKVVFRLKEPPASIAPRIRVGEEGKDTLALWMDDDVLQSFKTSKLQTWMMSVMREAARLSTSSSGASAGRLSHNKAVAGLSSTIVAQHLALSQQHDSTPTHGLDVESPLQAYPAPAVTPAVALRLDMNTPASELVLGRFGGAQSSGAVARAPSATAPPPAQQTTQPPSYPPLGGYGSFDDTRSAVLDGGDTVVLLDSASKRHRPEHQRFDLDLEAPAAPQPTSSLLRGSAIASRMQSSSTLQLEPLGLSPPQVPRHNADPDEPALAPAAPHAASSAAARSKSRAPLAPPANSAMASARGLDSLVTNLRQVVEAQTRAQQEEAREIVASVSAALQRQVTEARAAIAKDRSEFRSFVEARFAPYSTIAQKLAEETDVCVAGVNQASADVRQTATQHREQLTAVEAELRSLMPRIRGREEEELRQLDRQVDSNLSRLEAFFAETIAKQPTTLFAAALSGGGHSHDRLGASFHATEQAPPQHYSAGRLASGLAKVSVS